MTMKSTPTRYGAIAITMHWVSAFAIVLMLITGLRLGDTPPDQAATLVRIHVGLGITVGILTILRIVWWLAIDRRPAPVEPGTLQARLASLVHLGLYGAIIVMVTSGIGLVVLTGAMPQIIGGLTLPDFAAAPPALVHGLVGRLLIVLAIGHVCAALFHQFIRRDHLLARMGLGR